MVWQNTTNARTTSQGIYPKILLSDVLPATRLSLWWKVRREYYGWVHGTGDWHGSIRRQGNSAITSEKGTRLPFRASAPCFNGQPTLSISAPTTDFIHSTPRQENVCLPTTNKIKKVSMPVIRIGKGESGSGLISVEWVTCLPSIRISSGIIPMVRKILFREM